MIPRDKKYVMVAIYLYICKIYEQRLNFECLRFSNNSRPKFTDHELMTIYLLGLPSNAALKLRKYTISPTVT